MKVSRDTMGMPATVEVADTGANEEYIDRVFEYFTHVDEVFSTYKEGSEISCINRGEAAPAEYSDEMNEVFALSEDTRIATNGYFDIRTEGGGYDPSGLVKGWAIRNASLLLDSLGCKNFYIDVGGDIQTRGKKSETEEWSIGIRNPFQEGEIIKILYPRGCGVATSGTYLRGAHIYNPHEGGAAHTPFASLTIIAPDIYEADCFATAAFAMGEKGIGWIAAKEGLEGYAVNTEGIATMTSGFDTYTR